MKNLSSLFVFLFTSLIYSATVFGPVRYERTSGPPNVFDTSFVAYDTTLACTLFVVNGDETGDRRLSAASIEFNGEEIISESDFNQHIDTLIRVISLRSENNFHLHLRSAPGAFLTLSVIRPCDATVSLSVDTVSGDSACFSASANGWGSLKYSWDFDGDGVFDTTTSGNEICHKYEEADTYWAKVQVEDEAGCIAEDSGEIIIELVVITFVPESIAFYDFPDEFDIFCGYLDQINDLKYVGVVDRIDGWDEDTCQTLSLIYKGKYLGKYHNGSIFGESNSGNFLLISEASREIDCDDGVNIFAIDTNGTILWDTPCPSAFYYKFSPDDSLVLLFNGNHGGSGDIGPPNPMEMYPGNYEVWVYKTTTGEVVAHLEDWVNMKTWAFGLADNNLNRFYILEYDSLVAYDRYLNHLFTINPIIDVPPDSLNSFDTHPVFCVGEDNNVYVYSAYSGIGFDYPRFHFKDYDFWKLVPNPYVTVEAVCIDSMGNILWRQKTDSLRVSAFDFSYSSRYVLGYTGGGSPEKQVIVWETATNRMLFKKEFPPDTKREITLSRWARIFENPFTGNTFVMVKGDDYTKYYTLDGYEAQIDLNNLLYRGIRYNRFGDVYELRIKYGGYIVFKIRW